MRLFRGVRSQSGVLRSRIGVGVRSCFGGGRCSRIGEGRRVYLVAGAEPSAAVLGLGDPALGLQSAHDQTDGVLAGDPAAVARPGGARPGGRPVRPARQEGPGRPPGGSGSSSGRRRRNRPLARPVGVHLGSAPARRAGSGPGRDGVRARTSPSAGLPAHDPASVRTGPHARSARSVRSSTRISHRPYGPYARAVARTPPPDPLRSTAPPSRGTPAQGGHHDRHHPEHDAARRPRRSVRARIHTRTAPRPGLGVPGPHPGQGWGDGQQNPEAWGPAAVPEESDGFREWRSVGELAQSVPGCFSAFVLLVPGTIPLLIMYSLARSARNRAHRVFRLERDPVVDPRSRA